MPAVVGRLTYSSIASSGKVTCTTECLGRGVSAGTGKSIWWATFKCSAVGATALKLPVKTLKWQLTLRQQGQILGCGLSSALRSPECAQGIIIQLSAGTFLVHRRA